ncbi:MAG TPA: hypothetical protein VNM50_05585 [Chloroflexota bacterium]|jgi:hypothetical protein|nr:hypothetical protein [Chloroflexota bacterium]
MFSPRRVSPDTLPLDQNVVLLFFEFLLGSPDERGVWRVLGKDAEPLEVWLRHGWRILGQSQSSVTNLSGMQAVLLSYTLTRLVE